MARKPSTKRNQQHTDAAVPFVFKPANPRQALAQSLYQTCDWLFLLGGAGGGKTTTAMALAVKDILEGRRKKIIMIRPAVESGEKLGHIPGDMKEKLDPFHEPLFQALGKLAFRFPEDAIEQKAVGYLRGVNLEDCVVIVDEAQNLKYKQLKMVLSRLGHNGKMLLCGDCDQADLPARDSYYLCDLEEIADQIEHCKVPGVGFVDFLEEDCVRHPKLRALLRALEG